MRSNENEKLHYEVGWDFDTEVGGFWKGGRSYSV